MRCEITASSLDFPPSRTSRPPNRMVLTARGRRASYWGAPECSTPSGPAQGRFWAPGPVFRRPAKTSGISRFWGFCCRLSKSTRQRSHRTILQYRSKLAMQEQTSTFAPGPCCSNARHTANSPIARLRPCQPTTTNRTTNSFPRTKDD